MKAIELQAAGTGRALTLVEREVPTPAPHQVLLRMRAASINYRDAEIVGGHFSFPIPLPFVPLSDGVGEVVAAGSAVRRFRPGMRAVATFWEGWIDGPFDPVAAGRARGGPLDGMLAEYVLVNEACAVAVPDEVSDATAACLPCAGVTAWHALFVHATLLPGHVVLIHGTGGVALWAAQLALLAGATVVVTTRGRDKVERLHRLGVHHVVDRLAEADWPAAVQARVGHVDQVLDPVGGEVLQRSLPLLRASGMVHLVGYRESKDSSLDAWSLFASKVQVRATAVGSRASLEALVRAAAAQRVEAVIDRSFAWTDVAAALAHVEAGRHIGKVVLTWN